jgi:hypothetical protein
MTALISKMFAGDNDDRFEFGLDLLIRGIAAYAEPKQKQRSRASKARTS